MTANSFFQDRTAHDAAFGLLALAALLAAILLLVRTAAAESVWVYSLESTNYEGRFIRHASYLGELTSLTNDQDKQDATFIQRPALSGTPGAMSLEAGNRRGYYLRHEGFRIKLQRNDGTSQFFQDASFFQRDEYRSISFESVNFPRHFIRHSDFHLWLSKYDGTDPNFKKDSTFHNKSPALPLQIPIAPYGFYANAGLYNNNTVTVSSSWNYGSDDGSRGFVVQRYQNGWPTEVGTPPKRDPMLDQEHEDRVEIPAQDYNAGTNGEKFRVCAVGTEEIACSPAVTPRMGSGFADKTIDPADRTRIGKKQHVRKTQHAADGDIAVNRPSADLSDIIRQPEAERVTNVPGSDVTDQIGVGKILGPSRRVPGGEAATQDRDSYSNRYGTGVTDVMLKPGAACVAGHVWRVIRSSDLVCVTPQARALAAQENDEAAEHVDPNGAYGPNTCLSGYVWRNAFAGDLVCVTPSARDRVGAENRRGPTRIVGE